MTELTAAVEAATERLRALDLGDAFDPRAAKAIVDGGLHRLTVPREAGGLGASMAESVEVLAAIGAVDGSTALGFAMQVHVVGALRDSPAVPADSAIAVVPSDRRRRSAHQQRGHRGRWRLTGPRRDPRHDRPRRRRGRVAARRREDVDDVAAEPGVRVRDGEVAP